MNSSGTQPSPQDMEISVRITLINDETLEGSIFLLESHHSDAPMDALYHFLNKRRDNFFLFRNSRGREMLLPLNKSIVFELTHEAAEAARGKYPSMNETALYANRDSRVHELPLKITLTNGKVLRGELWFFDYDEPEHRNATSALNIERRFVPLHGDESSYFVHRDCILKATTSMVRTESESSTGSGLYDVSFYQHGGNDTY